MMHSLIPCLSRADLHPGRSIQVMVTGTLWNTQQGTPQIVQFSARSFWGSSLAVNRAVFVSVGGQPVSIAHKKKVTFILFYGPVSFVSQCGSQANICHDHIHQQTVYYGHIYFYSPLFILWVKLDLSYYVSRWYLLKPAWVLSTLTREQHYSTGIIIISIWLWHLKFCGERHL